MTAPGNDGSPRPWSDEDEAWVQSVIENNRVTVDEAAAIIEASGADSLRILEIRDER